MTHINAQIYDSDDNIISGLGLSIGEVVRLKIAVDDVSTNVYIRCLRADFNADALTGEDISVTNGNGQELLDDGLVQGRLVGGSWVDLYSSRLSLGGILPVDVKEFEIRINTSSSIDSIGQVGLGLVIECDK
jgi:hypothetical protein